VLSKQKLGAMIMKFVHMAQPLRDEPQWLCMISGVTRHRLTHSQSSVNNIEVGLSRKHRQSYRHADSRRQQQHTVVAARVTSNRATVTVFVTVWPWPLIF